MQEFTETMEILHAMQHGNFDCMTGQPSRDERDALAIAQAWGKRLEVLQPLLTRIKEHLPPDVKPLKELAP